MIRYLTAIAPNNTCHFHETRQQISAGAHVSIRGM